MNNALYNNVVFARQHPPRRPRVYRHRPSQLLDVFTDEEIRNRYRFRRDSLQYICSLVEEDMQRPTNRNRALSVEIQVLACLRFLASGCFYQVDADILGIDKSSVCRALTKFCESLVRKKDMFFDFPFTVDQKKENKYKFYKMGGFPSCILCVDGFHVQICTPYIDENSYVNRKSFHSINVQALTDADYKFVDIVAKWPGKTHDSFIWRQSDVRNYLQDNHLTLDDGLVIGDSGYALCRYLMTPYDDPSTRKERRFNATLKTCRSSVERAIGQLKRRFYCLKSGLRIQPDKACLIISACVILHNIAKKLGEEDFEGDDDIQYDCDPVDPAEDASDGKIVRQHITNTFF